MLVVHTCNTKLLRRLKSGELLFQTNPGKKVCNTPSHWKKSCACWHAPVIAAMAGSINREITVQEG
jgi:hypothetical protein